MKIEKIVLILICVLCFGFQSGKKIRVFTKSEIRSMKVKIVLEELRSVVFWDCDKDKVILFQDELIGENLFENFNYQNHSVFYREGIRREGKSVIIFFVKNKEDLQKYEDKFYNENLKEL